MGAEEDGYEAEGYEEEGYGIDTIALRTEDVMVYKQ